MTAFFLIFHETFFYAILSIILLAVGICCAIDKTSAIRMRITSGVPLKIWTRLRSGTSYVSSQLANQSSPSRCGLPFSEHGHTKFREKRRPLFVVCEEAELAVVLTMLPEAEAVTNETVSE